MHSYHPGLDAFAEEVLAFARRRMAADAGQLPIGVPRSPAELDAAGGVTITKEGMGASAALRLFSEVLEPACLSSDHHRYLAFVPAAPSEVSILADLVVSACSIYAGSWLEGGGAVWAENQALRWLADLAGLPEEAGGVFVSGGTNGNLSALVTARSAAAARRGGRPERWVLVVGESAHSSIEAAAAVMDVDLVAVPGDRLTGGALEPVLAGVSDRA
ncbi:MAG: pyridoxal-dependent decarboxylase, partial [Acidimicrobiales bacterium]|nr:pyridoxal-dependent decarboxylase [Acidimicrobiales bacterium]